MCIGDELVGYTRNTERSNAFVSHSFTSYAAGMAPFRRIERLDREEAFEDLMASLNPVAALRREVLKARRRSGLSQRELALKMGTSQSVVTRIERGEYAPSFQTLRKLAEATGSQLVIRLDAPTEAAGST